MSLISAVMACVCVYYTVKTKDMQFLPGEYDYILWELFPERRRGKRALTVKVYSEVLSGKRSGFPRGFFTDPACAAFRAEVCVKHLCKNIPKQSYIF